MKNTKGKNKETLVRLCAAAMCLALAMVLPFLTGQLREIGNKLCPMHLPVLLCGLLCGSGWGLLIGATAPLLRSLAFGMPALFPHAVGMAAELAVYGLTVALFYRFLPKKPPYLYLSLLLSMLAGRVAGGLFKYLLLGFGLLDTYSLPLFFTGYFIDTLPGVAVQLALIPLLFYALRRAGLVPKG